MEKSRLKILALGSVATGKTSLIKKLVKDKLAKSYKITVGVDVFTKEIEYEQGEYASLSIWDVGGQKRFDYVRDKFYQGVEGAIIVFDLTKKKTFDDTKKWLKDLKEFGGENTPFIILGNTINLSKKKVALIDSDKAREFTESEGGIYIETSSKNIDNLKDAVLELTHRIISKTD